MLDKFMLISSLITLILGVLILIALMSKTVFREMIRNVDKFAEEKSKGNYNFKNPSRVASIVKRLMDIIFSLFALISLTPVFTIIGIAIRIESKGNPFLKYRRHGSNGKSFFIYKFRTMKTSIELTEKNRLTSFEDPRVTRVGRYLRRTALDELPNLINVLLGTMTLVGTTVVREFEYENIHADYRDVLTKFKPGLTSLWVVSGDRREFSYDRRLLYDLYYIQNYSLKLDLSILFKTIILTFGETAST